MTTPAGRAVILAACPDPDILVTNPGMRQTPADFRSLSKTLIALTPLAMGVILSLGLMGLFGVPLNPANMIAFPLILGVGVDNGVHVLHDYLIRRREGRSGVSRASDASC